MTIYYISDHHFDHDNIIKYCNRPFSNVKEMNEYMIHQHNSTVKKYDIVHFLGDFAFKQSFDSVKEIIDKLNGYKHFILGNHDNRNHFRKMILFNDTVIGVSYSTLFHDETYNKVVFMNHRPLDKWPIQHDPYSQSIHIHGHIHNSKLECNIPCRYNASVEVVEYTPCTLEDLIQYNGEEIE